MDSSTLYEQHKGLLHQYCWTTLTRFVYEDVEELESDANYAFMLAYNTYDANKGKFSTWLVWNVRGYLWDQCMKRNKIARRTVPGNPAHYEARESRYAVLSASLSEDARAVINIIFCPPPDAPTFRSVGRWRKFLRHRLIDSGWSNARIAKAFAEVTGAMSS